MRAPTLSAVVVSYNVRDLLLQCIQSLEAARAAGHVDDIIVVDNASTDESAAAVRDRFPGVNVIDAPNLGYGAGANLGLTVATGEYIMVLNPDTLVPVKTVERLKEYMCAHADVGVCGPRLMYPDGTVQPSRRRFPGRLTPIMESTIFQHWWRSNPWSARYYMHDIPDDQIQDVDWLVGACLMVRRATIDRAGTFDPSFWMYCEETEWCWRIKCHGWRIVYVADAEITHHEGASTGQNVPRRQLAFDRSRIELQRRLFGTPTALFTEAGIRLSYALQLAIEWAKWLARHRRPLRRERIRFYRSLLFSRLHPSKRGPG